MNAHTKWMICCVYDSRHWTDKCRVAILHIFLADTIPSIPYMIRKLERMHMRASQGQIALVAVLRICAWSIACETEGETHYAGCFLVGGI